MKPESASIGIDQRCPCCNKNVMTRPNEMAVIEVSNASLTYARNVNNCRYCNSNIELIWEPTDEVINCHFFVRVPRGR